MCDAKINIFQGHLLYLYSQLVLILICWRHKGKVAKIIKLQMSHNTFKNKLFLHLSHRCVKTILYNLWQPSLWKKSTGISFWLYNSGLHYTGHILNKIILFRHLLTKPNHQRCQHSLGGFQGELWGSLAHRHDLSLRLRYKRSIRRIHISIYCVHLKLT